MAADSRFDAWWSDKEKREPTAEIKALRSPGKIGKIMKERMVGVGGTTPIGTSIVKEKPRFTLPTEPMTFGVEAAHRLIALRKPEQGQKQTPEMLRQKGTKEAYEEGIRLGYWE